MIGLSILDTISKSQPLENFEKRYDMLKAGL